MAAAVTADDEVAAATSGNCCLKLASKSSPGFCELVLRDHFALAGCSEGDMNGQSSHSSETTTAAFCIQRRARVVLALIGIHCRSLGSPLTEHGTGYGQRGAQRWCSVARTVEISSSDWLSLSVLLCFPGRGNAPQSPGSRKM